MINMNSVDKAKVRTCAVVFLRKNKKATSRQIYEFIASQKIPMIGDGASNTQTVARILKDSGKSWHFDYERDRYNRYIWFLRE